MNFLRGGRVLFRQRFGLILVVSAMLFEYPGTLRFGGHFILPRHNKDAVMHLYPGRLFLGGCSTQAQAEI